VAWRCSTMRGLPELSRKGLSCVWLPTALRGEVARVLPRGSSVPSAKCIIVETEGWLGMGKGWAWRSARGKIKDWGTWKGMGGGRNVTGLRKAGRLLKLLGFLPVNGEGGRTRQISMGQPLVSPGWAPPIAALSVGMTAIVTRTEEEICSTVWSWARAAIEVLDRRRPTWRN
jgi:hypothetical protein